MPRRSNYARGYEVERRVIQELTKLGYQTVRSAGSHTPIDILAWNETEVLFIQVKRCKLKSNLGTMFRKGLNELAGVRVPKNGRKEVWVWCDREGFYREEVS